MDKSQVAVYTDAMFRKSSFVFFMVVFSVLAISVVYASSTLELWTSEVSVKSACNFENYYFIVPENVAGTSEFMLKTQTPVNLSESKIAVALQNGAVLKVGDRINLIDKAEGEPILSSLEGIDLRGGSLKGGTLFTGYDLNLDLTEGALAVVATSAGKTLLLESSIDEPAGEAIPEAQALLGSQIASAALVAKTADLASEAKAALNSADKKNLHCSYQQVAELMITILQLI